MKARPNIFKPSRYNCFIDLPDTGVRLGYNGISTAGVEYPIGIAGEIDRILGEPNTEYSDKLLPIKYSLVENGFLIPDEIDEIAFLKVKNRSERFRAKHANYTVLITRDCNLRCPYCYQERAKGPISPEVCDAFLNMVEVESRGRKPVGITWFGGEPLLYWDVLNGLMKKLQRIARKERLIYTSSIITNGYLLTPKIAKLLRKMGCTDAQVTLDGPKRIHDSKRVLPGGGPTYDRIIRNVIESSPHIQIVLRVNIDKDNVEYIDELLDDLIAAGVRGRASVYFQRIQPYTEVCADVAGACFGAEDFSKWEALFTMKMIEKGFGAARYPRLKGGICLADSISGKTICPDGNIVKCWNDISYAEEAVGHLIKPEISEAEMMRNRLKWLAWDPLQKSECLECAVLPNCMGGCPYSAMRSENPDRGDCSTLKYNLKETIGLTYLHKRAVEEIKRRRETKDPSEV